MELSPGPKTRRKSAGAKWRRQADWQSSKPKHSGAEMFLKSHLKRYHLEVQLWITFGVVGCPLIYRMARNLKYFLPRSTPKSHIFTKYDKTSISWICQWLKVDLQVILNEIDALFLQLVRGDLNHSRTGRHLTQICSFFHTGYSFWYWLCIFLHNLTWIVLSVHKLNKLGKFL